MEDGPIARFLERIRKVAIAEFDIELEYPMEFVLDDPEVLTDNA